MDKELGHLTKVPLREVWLNEASDFTPWLASEENLSILGETIGLELELVSCEEAVGPYSADIVCTDTATSDTVIIENQIEKTDHSHLGQLLVYTAGLEAKTVVWIAASFTAQHRAALDRLNEVTDERANFFGLEIELWRIGDSAIAPKFNIVSQPNDWTRTAHEARTLTPWKQAQLEFWTGYAEFLREHGVSNPPKPLPQSWMNHSLGRSGFCYTSVFSNWDNVRNSFGYEIRAEMVAYSDYASSRFEEILAHKKEFDAAVGEESVVHAPDNQRTKKIILFRTEKNLEDRSRWSEIFEWLWVRTSKIDEIFRPIVREL